MPFAFEFATTRRILFGPGSLGNLPDIGQTLGQSPLLVTGSQANRFPLIEMLQATGLETTIFSVTHEPTTQTVLQGVSLARESDCDMVIAIGGGSVLDAGKAIAMLIANGGEPLDYLEVIGRGLPITEPSAPFLAIPTTAGTGTEVTRNAVLKSPQHGVKVSLRSPFMLPAIALVDPQLTHSLPPGITASTGLDALTQVVEPYVSHRANPLTDGLCREAMVRAARSLEAVCQDGDDASARYDMAVTSLFGGLALANAGLGAVHGFAGPMGGMFPAPHGVICANLLPHVMAANVQALHTRDPASPALSRYDQVARLLTGQVDAAATDGVAWVGTLVDKLALPALSDYGVTADLFPEIIEKAQRASSMKGNPIQLTEEELLSILAAATGSMGP
ncbi:MAG: iron-containing alcohol dehydrogenase [Chloroflexota bacterium]|nr:iron-containing alcohol dehydrogenase [Chloroflexota bacterium]